MEDFQFIYLFTGLFDESSDNVTDFEGFQAGIEDPLLP
jgi:hypothetical protein